MLLIKKLGKGYSYENERFSTRVRCLLVDLRRQIILYLKVFDIILMLNVSERHTTLNLFKNCYR